MARPREMHDRLVDEVVDELRAYQREVDQLDEAACAYLGISRVDARCLDTIHHLGPMNPSALAKAMGLSASSMTTVLDRLERLGYARRVRDKQDRRQVFVEMTDKARRRAMAVYGPIAADNPRKFAGYDAHQLEFLRDFLRAERKSVAGYVARVRKMAATKKPRSRPS